MLGGSSDQLVTIELADELLRNGLLGWVVVLGGTGRDDVDLSSAAANDLDALLVVVGQVDGGTNDVVELNVGDVAGGLEVDLLGVGNLDAGDHVREQDSDTVAVVNRDVGDLAGDLHNAILDLVQLDLLLDVADGDNNVVLTLEVLLSSATTTSSTTAVTG
jgi:hypothetical protein